MPQITFNGKTYNDIAEMPAVERQAYEQIMAHFKDENQDGIPDIFQGDVVSNIVSAVASTDFVVDGKPCEPFRPGGQLDGVGRSPFPRDRGRQPFHLEQTKAG